MITPQELETKEFGVSFRGYNKDEIDDFLDALLVDYERIYKENGSMKSKMNVLAEKIEEYKKEEDSLRNALMTAQKLGENMVEEAKTKSENMVEDAKRKSELIIKDAQVKAEKILSTMNAQICQERKKLEEAKREADVFRARVASLYNAQLKLLESTVSEKSVVDEGVLASLAGAKELAKLKKEMAATEETSAQPQEELQQPKAEESVVNQKVFEEVVAAQPAKMAAAEEAKTSNFNIDISLDGVKTRD